MLRTLLLSALLLSPGESDAVRVGFVGLHGGAYEIFESVAADAGAECSYFADDAIERRELDLSQLDVLLIQHARDDQRRALEEAIRAGKQGGTPLRVITLGGGAERTLAGIASEGFIESDPRLEAFYRALVPENASRLLRYVVATTRGTPPRETEPVAVEIGKLRHPEYSQPFSDVASLREFVRRRGIDPELAPRVAIVAHASHYLLQQPRVVAALVAEFERRGCFAFVAIDGEPGKADYERFLLEIAPDVVIHTCHATETAAFRERLDAPQLSALFFRGPSIRDWENGVVGLSPSECVFQVTSQELIGATEPIATSGTEHGGGSAESFTPIPERVSRLAERALSYVALRRTANADKKLAIVYYDREASKASLLRGSTTGSFMNAPRSLLNVLRALRDAGYRVDVPDSEDALLARIQRSGRVAGIHGQGEVDALASGGEAAVIDADTYEQWLTSRVPSAAREALEKRWGEAPGNLCRTQRGGKPALVVPLVRLGNVVLVPQPLRGEAYDSSQLHDKLTPPPHSYLAAYFWLDREFGANAMLHFGTHGSEFALPGKSVGLGASDWSDIVIGRLPNFVPWVMNNVGESSPAKRRSYAVLLDHLVPPTTEAGLADGLRALHDDVDRFDRVGDGALRERMRATIGEKANQEKLDVDLGFDLSARPPSDGEIEMIQLRLHEIEEELTPTSLHVLGEAPADEARLPWLVHCAGQSFLDALGSVPGIGPFPESHAREQARAIGLEVIRRHLRDGLSAADAIAAVGGRPASELPKGLVDALAEIAKIDRGLASTGDEIGNLLRGLAGRFVPPGPGNAPERNPAAVPTGRNMHLLDPKELPTKEAWEIGAKLADALVSKHFAEQGTWPTKVAFQMSAFSSWRDFGVMEAQILRLLGCEPVRDARGAVIDVKIVPREVLGRPRVDVFLSLHSYYRDLLEDRAHLLDRAVNLASEQDEPDNGVRIATREREAALRAAGMGAERAARLAGARLFGTAPGQIGTPGYYYLVERSGDWRDRSDLMNAYLAQVRYAYTEGAWGEESKEAFESAIGNAQYVLRNWSDTTTSPITNKYDWYTGGSLALAIETISGQAPRYVLSDLRDPDRAELIEAEDALRRDIRARALNRKWIEGMMREGYAGADQLAVVASNAFGWQVMRKGAVPNELFEKLADVYVRDALGLGLRDFFERENPYALQDIAETLLEAARKDLWQASEATLRELAAVRDESRKKHGDGGGLRSAGNEGLEAFAQEKLGKDEMASVEGKVLEKITPPPPQPNPTSTTVSTPGLRVALSFAAMLALIAIGFLFRRGGNS